MEKRKILIVEDEVIIAMEMKSYLEKSGYKVVSISTNFVSAIKDFKKYLPDIVLIDINLSEEKTGIDVAEQINKIKITPLIFITAYSSTPNIHKASMQNPCSILVKPINREELKINILLALSNNSNLKTHNNNVVLYKNCYYDVTSEHICENDNIIILSKRERKLMNYFVEKINTTIFIDDIKDYVWGKIAVSDGSVRTLIYRLRQKLKKSECIKTTSEGWILTCVEQ